ncbi:hypothetical protein N2603_40100 [Bradyrhizobium huanghuaihaiense]|uniref:hypothetical protein n=1 Tax=Bradyrhizobium huanghuaihaiense TaxID=990078 RepID=UPI0021A9A298|nr:hypothetical protein [Bradyrhizobium sp. CB3035]UWU76060.1 hypothetical protein N2603_40100 [Bradyrhizobium sp. CB3035]
MKSIGRADPSQVEAAGADRTGELSRASLEPGLFPGERGRSFDAVVERMRSGRQDKTAASDVTAPTRNEIKTAKRDMDSLLEKFETCRAAAMQPCNSQQAQGLIDRVVEAGSTALEYYANLPANLARRILPDDQVRRLRDDTLDAGNQCNKVATPILYSLENRRKQAEALLYNVQDAAPPDQLSRVVAGVANQYAACMEWWGKKALRFERMQSVCAASAHLPSSTPEMRKAEEAQLRLNTGWGLNTKCMYLQSRIALARLLVESRASTLAPHVRAALMDEGGRVRLLGTFVGDVFPAFISTGDAVRGGAVLDAEHCAVLEGVMERLSEFASQLSSMLAPLREAGTEPDLPLQLLGEIVDGAWVTANDVMRLLALQPKTEMTIEPPAWAALPENTALLGEGTPVRRKGKARRAEAAGEGSSTASPTPPQLVRPDAARPATGKVIVLSDLGTKKLATAEEAAASSSATDHLEMWQAPPARKALPGLLERLDELLQFDLPAQQRAASQVRQMKPEDAEYVLDRVIKRLQTQSSEIKACVKALKEPRREGLLTAAQVPEVHKKIVRLQRMRSEVQGQENSLNDRKAAIASDCLKTYAFPSQKYLVQLREAGELASVDPPHALKGEPGTLFEIKLQPMALSSGATPRPMWVHIHTKRPVHAWQLAMLGDREFAACHVKSDEQRGYNQHWQSARAAEGHENVVIHRGKLTPAFCRSLLSTADGRYPWPLLPDAEQMARLGIQ